MKKLIPFQGKINFEPSYKQYLVWDMLSPNHCDKCGGTLEMRAVGTDNNGNVIKKPFCSKCGTSDIPRLVLYGGAAGSGKQLSMDSSICTPFGFRKLKDIKVGDIITNPMTGGMQKVVYLHPIGEHDFYRVWFVDGTYADCSSGHLWKAHQSGKRTKAFMKYGGDRDQLWPAISLYNWYKDKKEKGMYKGDHLIIPLTEPVKFTVSNRKTPIDPYIMGFIIGDGCIAESVLRSGYVTVTTMDQEVVDRFIECGYDMSNWKQKEGNKARDYFVRSNNIVENIRSLGIAGNKSQTHIIPRGYMYGTVEERIRLMQGLMDSDGYVDQRGHLSYSTTSEQLAEDVAWLVSSLGGVASISEDDGVYKKDGVKHICSRVHTVWIRTKMDPDLCGLSRKKKLARYEFNGGFSELGKRIVDVEYIGKKTSRCISVSDPSGLYVVDDFTVTHNSWLGTAWGVTTCLRFPGARFALARKVLKILRGTTFVTLKNVLNTFGLTEGVNYHVDYVNLIVTFWNGSQIICLGLEDKPSDPEHSWLGSFEFTCFYCDEASEVSEKAIEVLLSRCRWMIAETFIVPKGLMGTNPAICWLRDRFVQDENGKKLEVLPEGYRFVPATVFDNKSPEFVAVYVNNLLAIKDVFTRNRLLYGLWDNPSGNRNAAYHSFNSITHIKTGLKDRVYNKLRPLIISIDFNTVPQMSAILCQVDYDSKVFYVLQEFVGKPSEKLNNTPAFSRMLSETLTAMGHMGGVIITGDSSGLQRSTQTEDGVNNYTILMNALNNEILRPQLKLLSKQPAHITRLDFINCLFENFDGWTIQIDFRCHKLTEDLLRQMKNEDGTKCKHVGVGSDGIKCELLGHFSDCFDYAVVTMLGNMYAKFKSKPVSNSPIVTIGANEHAYSVQSDWDY